VPTLLTALLSGPDPERLHKTMPALLQMKKLDLAALQQAMA
jgi:hypothetical protein